jgi:hypothetical protein
MRIAAAAAARSRPRVSLVERTIGAAVFGAGAILAQGLAMTHRRMWCCVAALMLLGLDAGCGESGGPPSFDGTPPPVDLGPDSVPDLGQVADPYQGTCLEPVVACFDFVAPCQQQSVVGMPGFTATASNGAAYTMSFADGTSQATASNGTTCWNGSTDPATNDLIYTTPSGTYRERTVGNGRQITCPDGSTQMAPGGDASWVTVLGACAESH